MNNKLVLNLSIFGVMVGALNLFGIMGENEWILWLLFWIVASMLIVKKEKESPFAASFLSGIIFTILVYLTQILGFDLYVQNNPMIQERVKTLGTETNPRIYFLSIGLLLAVGNGGILAFITMGLQYLRESRKK